MEEFLAFGLRRGTLEQISRRARVSRMTVHRRFGNKQELIGAVVLREARMILGEVVDAMDGEGTPAEQVTEGLVYGVVRTWEHPLFKRLLETEPESIVPYFTTSGGPRIAAVSEGVVRRIRRAADAAHSDCSDAAAGVGVRFGWSALLNPRGRFALSDADSLRDIMSFLVPRLLAPEEK